MGVFDYSKFEFLCLERAMTQTAVAKATGVPQQSLSAWKNGKFTPRAERIHKLADYFGVDWTYFLKEGG